MKIEKFPSNITEELAEETGWHIGDGSMSYYNNQGVKKGIYQLLRGHIEDDKQHYIEGVKPIFKKLYGIDISLREMSSTRVFGFQIWSNELVKLKEKLGLPTGPKTSIEIPKIFLKNGVLRAAVLRGIFDTDGCVYLEKKNGKLYPRLEIKTISFPLASQLKENFNELGLRATMYKEKFVKKGGQKDSYAVVIRGVEMFDLFMKVVKPQNPKHSIKHLKFTQSFK